MLEYARIFLNGRTALFDGHDGRTDVSVGQTP
jgi:hypothetical protein